MSADLTSFAGLPEEPALLEIYGGLIESLSGMVAQPALTLLNIWSYESPYLSAAPLLPRLYRLDLNGGFESLHGLEGQPIRELSIEGNMLSNIDALAELPELRQLRYATGQPTDFAPLVQNPNFAEGSMLMLGFNAPDCNSPGVSELMARGVIVLHSRQACPGP